MDEELAQTILDRLSGLDLAVHALALMLDELHTERFLIAVDSLNHDLNVLRSTIPISPLCMRSEAALVRALELLGAGDSSP